jgi:hypothetical protein
MRIRLVLYNITDVDVRTAFMARTAGTKETVDIVAVMLAIKGEWNEDQLSALSTAQVENYRKAFKSHSGQELRRMLSNVFQFDRVANASDRMKAVPQRAREALKQIDAESLINARGVARLGV